MIIAIAKPPMWNEINAAFHVEGKAVIFCWASTIYNPTGAEIPHQLIAHENVHRIQQNGAPEAWWRRYIDDVAFRAAQEIPAHRAEFHEYCTGNTTRIQRRIYLRHCARRLSGPLYGYPLKFEEAMRVIKQKEAPQ